MNGMDKDTVLRHIFSTIAMTSAGDPKKGAGVCIMDDMEYDICHTCVLQIEPLECYKDAMRGVMIDFDELPPLRMTNPGGVKPDVLLDSDRVDMSMTEANLLLQADTYMIPAWKAPQKAPVGMWLVSAYGNRYGEYLFKCSVVTKEKLPNMPEMKILAYSLTPEVAGVLDECKVGVEEFRPCIMQTRTQLQPVLVLTGETGLLYTPLRHRSDSDSINAVYIPEKGVRVYGDAWSDEIQAYKKLQSKKEVVMKGMLSNPLAAKKDAIKPIGVATPEAEPAAEEAKQEEAKVVQADGSKHEVAAAVTAKVNTDVRPADDGVTEAEPDAQEGVQTAEPAETEAAEEQAKPAEQEEKPKPQRTQKPVQKGGVGAIDLKRVLEILGTTVSAIQPAEFDKALNAIRMLRDIQIAAARLETNIALGIAEPSQKAMMAVAEFQKMLGK